MRKRMLRWAKPGAAYVPFIGDGDLSERLYTDRLIYGADIDPERVEHARDKLPSTASIKMADCDQWPFQGLKTQITVCDFDAYDDPYASFRAFWGNANKGDRLVMFFTDGHRLAIQRTGYWVHPDGQTTYLATAAQKFKPYYFYVNQHIWPWLEKYIEPYRMLDKFVYLRGTVAYLAVAVEQ
jgi:hypothetical protein